MTVWGVKFDQVGLQQYDALTADVEGVVGDDAADQIVQFFGVGGGSVDRNRGPGLGEFSGLGATCSGRYAGGVARPAVVLVQFLRDRASCEERVSGLACAASAKAANADLP